MIRLLLFISVIVLASSCQVQKVQKNIDGSWKILTYRKTNPQGLIYYYQPTGIIEFTNSSENRDDYIVDITFEDNGVQKNLENIGYIEITDADHFLMHPLDSTGAYSESYEGRILLSTKNDLKWVYNDGKAEHYFVLEK